MPFDSLYATAPAASLAAAKPLHLNVRMPDGGRLAPPAEAGVKVIELLSRFGVPVREASEGEGACTAGRVRIPAPWQAKVARPSAQEAAALAGLADADATTRFICDLTMTPELDGLELELTWDALVPQTYWIAG